MLEPRAVIRYECENWEDFIRQVRERVGKVSGERIYRGQRDVNLRLSSIFERWLWRLAQKDKNPNRNVREVFAPNALEAIRDSYRLRFKDFARGLPGLETESMQEFDWWVLGRHHGLITRYSIGRCLLTLPRFSLLLITANFGLQDSRTD